MSQNFCIVDIETTGKKGNRHKITEIAIIEFDGEKIIDSYSTLINPETSIPYFISKLTGITAEMVEEAPKFYEVAKEIFQRLEGRTFVAHNVFFDYNIIKKEYSDLGFHFSAPKLCTVRLARQFFPGHKSYSLGKICNDLEIAITSRHRALGDAKATVQLFQKILELQTDPKLLSTYVQTKNQVILPTHINRAEVDSLPKKIGIYYLLDENFKTLYVGKSINISKRVFSHFKPDLARKNDLRLKNLIHRVDFQIVGNEPISYLLEALEIKRLRPSFNRALNRKNFKYLLVYSIKNSFIELGASTVTSETDNPALRFRSRKVIQGVIEKLYFKAFGILPEERELIKMKVALGPELFNRRIERVLQDFDYDKPSFIKSFLSEISSQKIDLVFEDGRCAKILWIDSGSVIKELKVNEDPDIKRLILRKCLKHQLFV